jgi:hypothetical protein
MVCIDCGCSITKGRKRCNPCSANNRSPNHYKSGWAKYEFEGIKYRSTWEIEFAKILLACGVEFQYEVFHKETKTRPDFYIVAKDRFVEIHPDYHGKKKALPENCILVKTLSHTRAIALSICFSLEREKTIDYIGKMTKKSRRGLNKIAMDLCVYLRNAMYERDGK